MTDKLRECLESITDELIEGIGHGRVEAQGKAMDLLTELREHHRNQRTEPKPTADVVEAIAKAFYSREREGWLREHPGDLFAEWDDCDYGPFKDKWRDTARAALASITTQQSSPPNTLEVAVKSLVGRMKVAGLSVRKLAELAGTSPATTHRIMNGQSLCLASMLKVERVLDEYDTRWIDREREALDAAWNQRVASPPSDDLVKRLREADRNSVQRTLGSHIFGEAADRIEQQASQIAELRALLREAVTDWRARQSDDFLHRADAALAENPDA